MVEIMSSNFRLYIRDTTKESNEASSFLLKIENSYTSAPFMVLLTKIWLTYTLVI